MKPQKVELLREILIQAEQKFLLTKEIETDAIAAALRYEDATDREFAAFVCAVLAYGKVAHINKSVRSLIDPLGPQPVQFILSKTQKELSLIVRDWKHRFNTSEDAIHLFCLLQSIYQREASLEKFMCEGADLSNIKNVLENFVDKIEVRLKELKIKPKKSFWFFFPRPSSGSACKRLNLYLRWMVGRGPFDLKLWESLSESILMIPLDVHLLNQARSLRLTRRKQADWRTVEEVTDKLKFLDQSNPTRFDFALCHLGIKGKILASLALFFLCSCMSAQNLREQNLQDQKQIAETAPIKVAAKKAKFTSQDKARFLRAIKDDDIVQVRFFISMGIDVNENFKFPNADVETALLAAIEAQSAKSFKILLEQNIDPDALRDKNRSELIEAILSRQKDVALKLIEKGANPNRNIDETGETALMSAARVGLCDVVQKLLEKKAKANIQNDDGYTALMYASEYGHKVCIEALVANGADQSIKNRAGKTADDLKKR